MCLFSVVCRLWPNTDRATFIIIQNIRSFVRIDFNCIFSEGDV